MDMLLDLLRSKDLDHYHKVKTHFFGPQARYTSGKALEQSSVVYSTFPRSGNSLMRKYFESLTGVATGSDQIMMHQGNVSL